jgi:hypothetical protein
MVMLKDRKLEPFDWLSTGFHGLVPWFPSLLVPKLELGNQEAWEPGNYSFKLNR